MSHKRRTAFLWDSNSHYQDLEFSTLSTRPSVVLLIIEVRLCNRFLSCAYTIVWLLYLFLKLFGFVFYLCCLRYFLLYLISWRNFISLKWSWGIYSVAVVPVMYYFWSFFICQWYFLWVFFNCIILKKYMALFDIFLNN